MSKFSRGGIVLIAHRQLVDRGRFPAVTVRLGQWLDCSVNQYGTSLAEGHYHYRTALRIGSLPNVARKTYSPRWSHRRALTIAWEGKDRARDWALRREQALAEQFCRHVGQNHDPARCGCSAVTLRRARRAL